MTIECAPGGRLLGLPLLVPLLQTSVYFKVRAEARAGAGQGVFEDALFLKKSAEEASEGAFKGRVFVPLREPRFVALGDRFLGLF